MKRCKTASGPPWRNREMAAPICVPHRKNPDKTDPVQMAYTAPEKEGGKVLGVVAVE